MPSFRNASLDLLLRYNEPEIVRERRRDHDGRVCIFDLVTAGETGHDPKIFRRSAVELLNFRPAGLFQGPNVSFLSRSRNYIQRFATSKKHGQGADRLIAYNGFRARANDRRFFG